jgi:peroxin-4
MSNVSAQKRLKKELEKLSKANLDDSDNSDSDIHLTPSSTNIMVWTALIRGPQGSPYEGGVYQLNISCGSDYPLNPPLMTFVTKIFHPNVLFRSGEICLDILKKEWSPAWGLQAACRAIVSLLNDPAADSPLNCDAGNMLRAGDTLAFEATARMFCEEHGKAVVWPV